MQMDEYQRMYEAEQTHFWFRGTRAVVFDQVRDLAAVPVQVLDLGCGTGGTLTQMPARWSSFGLDFSNEQRLSKLLEGLEKGANAVPRAFPPAATGDEPGEPGEAKTQRTREADQNKAPAAPHREPPKLMRRNRNAYISVLFYLF